MTIQPISAASVALYLTPADLRELDVDPEALTAEHALELARNAFRQAGLPLEPPVEIETYPDKCGVLVFIHINPVQPAAWYFEDWEALLAAAVLLGEEDAALYWWEDGCWLVLPGQDAGLAARLSEFGSQELEDSYIIPRLAEYGKCLIPENALAVLRRHFKLGT